MKRAATRVAASAIPTAAQLCSVGPDKAALSVIDDTGNAGDLSGIQAGFERSLEAFTESQSELSSERSGRSRAVEQIPVLRRALDEVRVQATRHVQDRISNCKPGRTNATACCGLFKANDWLAEIEMNAKIWVGTRLVDAGTPAALARMFVMRNVRVLFVPGGTTGIPAHTTAAFGVLLAQPLQV